MHQVSLSGQNTIAIDVEADMTYFVRKDIGFNVTAPRTSDRMNLRE
jgi:hypothetical protein